MIVSFILGIMKARGYWLIFVVLGGTALDYIVAHGSDSWRIQAGVGASSLTIVQSLLWVATVNIIAYALGRGLRWLYDWYRRQPA